MLEFLRNHRRREVASHPFPEAYREIITKNVAYAALLTEEERTELEGLVANFIAEKPFEGCGGLELTDEIRVTVAAQACILLLGRENDLYPNLDVVLVYPSAYRARTTRSAGSVAIVGEDARLGESYRQGAVVLAWDETKRGGRSMHDGKNLVFHEFAHQLDSEDGSMDGTPELDSNDALSEWGHVLSEEYTELVDRLHAGRATDIDAYGATNAAEFFAVITEMFFERSARMRKHHTALYEELVAFYKQDPAKRRDDHANAAQAEPSPE